MSTKPSSCNNEARIGEELVICVKKAGHKGWHNNRKGDFW